MEEQKLCRDCKYIELASSYWDEGKHHEFAKCGKTVDLVSGRAKEYCCIHRNMNYEMLDGMCGSKGKWWEMKTVSINQIELTDKAVKVSFWNKLKNLFGDKNAN